MKPIILISSLGLLISNISHAQVACYNCGTEAPTCAQLRDNSAPSRFNLKNVGDRSIECQLKQQMKDVSVIISIIIGNKERLKQFQTKNKLFKQRVEELEDHLDEIKKQIKSVQKKLRQARNAKEYKLAAEYSKQLLKLKTHKFKIEDNLKDNRKKLKSDMKQYNRSKKAIDKLIKGYDADIKKLFKWSEPQNLPDHFPKD